MSKPMIATLLALVLALPVAARQDAAPPEADGAKVQASMEKFQLDLQQAETEAVAKNVTLTPDEASAFWPQFKAYQSEQKKIGDGQVAAVRRFADNFKELTDTQALAYIDALLARDQQIHDLRKKYLAMYSKTIGPRRAATVIHIARKMGFQSQAQLAVVIPLVC
jgi:Tfp pilus assembly protein FimT